MSDKPPIKDEKFEKDFEIIVKLGYGSAGDVFKVIKKKTQELFAVKLIESSTENFEKKCASSLLTKSFDCDRLVKIYDVWLENNVIGESLYIQMEICEHTLEEVIKKIFDESLNANNLLSEVGFKKMNEISVQILEGVSYLHNHEKPVMHRDLNLVNILVNNIRINNENCYEVKIADFDLTKLSETEESNTEDQGTPKFMAPEVMGRIYNKKADIFSLGVIFERMYNIDLSE
jgi:serine/threonine protein kinase